jgi:GTP-binding protein
MAIPNCLWFCKNNWMSDHWENVTDNVEALLDMVIENVPALKFLKERHKCYFFFAFTGRIAIGRLKEVF